MQMATKQQCQQQWPLKDENNEELILPSDLYWNYVFPYTAVDNRIIINKHTKSTQFYAGHRAELDAAYLEKHRGEPHISMTFINHIIDIVNCYEDICMHTDLVEEPSLELLRDVRRNWDKHISRICLQSPSKRLCDCLALFLFQVNDYEYAKEIPLLFCGAGTVQDVVKFYSLVDPNSINGHVTIDQLTSNSTPLVYG